MRAVRSWHSLTTAAGRPIACIGVFAAVCHAVSPRKTHLTDLTNLDFSTIHSPHTEHISYTTTTCNSIRRWQRPWTFTGPSSTTQRSRILRSSSMTAPSTFIASSSAVRQSTLHHSLPAASRYISLALLAITAPELICLQESGSKEVELHEDDPEAMMSMLRHIYGLPYDELAYGTSCLLSQHASTFVVAEKYQILGLQSDICSNIQSMLDSHIYPLEDFLKAARTVFTLTTSNSIARVPMARECTTRLQELRERDDFVSLLRKLPDLSLESSRTPTLSAHSRETGSASLRPTAEVCPAALTS
jgi:hypothetical protein